MSVENPEVVTTTAPPATTTTAPPATTTTTAPPVPDWSPEWRDKIAGDDKEFRKTLDRFNSPADVAKSWKEISTKVSSGEYKKTIPFPDKGTPEQQAEWRAEMGLPASADKYDLKLPDGLVIGEDDKPVIDKFLAKILPKNVPADAASAAVAAYYEIQNEAQSQAVEQDRAFQIQAEETLRAEWGPEYLPNKNRAEDFAVHTFGAEVGKALMEAGPDVVKAVSGLARQLNPEMTLVPNSANPSQAIADELAALNKIIGTNEWYNSPDKQARYLQLQQGQEAIKKRG